MSSRQKENLLKDNFADAQSQPVTEAGLRHRFPGAEIIGTVGETGVVLAERTPHGRRIKAAIRHPALIPKGKEFHGVQRQSMTETALLRPVGIEEASRTAKSILTAKKETTLGLELEGFVHDSAGRLVPAGLQIELQQGLREDAMTGHVNSLSALAVRRATGIMRRERIEKERGNIVIDSSAPLTLGAERIQDSRGLRSSEDEYVRAMSKILSIQNILLREDQMDPRVAEALNQIANANGFKNIDEAVSSQGVSPLWDVAASHLSLGIPPQTEIGIAVGNIFAGDMATAANFLCHSTPLYQGEKVMITEQGGKKVAVKDVRALKRHLFRTTYVTEPFIADPDEYAGRIEKGIIEGIATTGDRSAFFSRWSDIPLVSSAHARTRIRGYGKEGSNIQRVEYVGAGSSPSVYDMLARDAYLVVLWTAALEAVSQKQSPGEYFKEKGFSAIGEWKNQLELEISHAVYGTENTAVDNLISQNLRFMEYMYEKYPHLKDYIRFTQSRLRNLREKPSARTVNEYTRNPKGNIADVILKMKDDGVLDIEILNQLNKHQSDVSQIIINNRGNFAKLLEFVN